MSDDKKTVNKKKKKVDSKKTPSFSLGPKGVTNSYAKSQGQGEKRTRDAPKAHFGPEAGEPDVESEWPSTT